MFVAIFAAVFPAADPVETYIKLKEFGNLLLPVSIMLAPFILNEALPIEEAVLWKGVIKAVREEVKGGAPLAAYNKLEIESPDTLSVNQNLVTWPVLGEGNWVILK